MKTNSATTIIIILIFSVATVTLGISQGYAQTKTHQPIVRAVMFWMDGCPHCHHVLEEVLPPIQAKYGDQLEIKLIELVGGEEVVALYQLAESRGIPKEQVGVPFLVIGEHTLIGAEQIPAELPGLIDSYLASGGIDWPEIPGLEAGAQTATPSPPSASEKPISGSIVEAVLFNTPDCHDCQLVIAQAITPARERYGDLFHLQTVNIITSEDVEYLYHVAAAYGFQKEQVDLPLLIIGDTVLIGDQIAASLEDTVEAYMAHGGVRAPELPERSGPPTPAAATEKAVTTQTSGFPLAIGVLAVMLAAVIFSSFDFVRSFRGSTSPITEWLGKFEWLIPPLVLIGMGVAAYLAYVETQAVQAVCGPVGDCNTVQSSPYARLFGMLPIGGLGLVGYLLILVAWFVQRNGNREASAWAGLALFGMAYGGALFSLYLTFLEAFVIRAVCVWCLASAVIMALLNLFSLETALRQIKPG